MWTLDEVTLRRKGRALLAGVSLTVDDGELVVLAGQNGAGKSTLLRVLSGELTNFEGGATHDDTPLSTLSPRALAERRAVMPQSVHLPFSYTVSEVVALGRFARGDGVDALRDIVRAALDEVQARALAARVYSTLSGGEQQRVQLARVLAQLEGSGRPPALFLDEPTAHVDLARQHELFARVRARVDRGHACLAVIHDLAIAARYATRVVLLKEGRVVVDGPPAIALTPEHVGEAFDARMVAVPSPTQATPLIVYAGPRGEGERAGARSVPD